MIFDEKYLSSSILLTYRISLSVCFQFLRYWVKNKKHTACRFNKKMLSLQKQAAYVIIEQILSSVLELSQKERII